MFEQALDLVERIEVGMGTGGKKWQQAGRRDLGLRIVRNVMACKTSHVAQALRPECRLRMACDVPSPMPVASKARLIDHSLAKRYIAA